MKRHTLTILVAALIANTMAFMPTASAGLVIYPGSNCQPNSGYDVGDFTTSDGIIYIGDLAGGWVTCPMPNNFDKISGWKYVTVNVSAHGLDNEEYIYCYVNNRDMNGRRYSYGYGRGKPRQGSSSSFRITTNNNAWTVGYQNLRCRVPVWSEINYYKTYN